MCHARLERAASAVSSGALSPHTPQPQRDHGTHFSLPTRPRLAQRVVCVLPPSLVIGLWFRVPLVERFVHPRLNGSFNSSTERLVGGKLLKQFSHQVSVCLLSDGIGEGDFVRRKADGDLRSLERSLAQYCSISIHCSIDMTAARCVMQD